MLFKNLFSQKHQIRLLQARPFDENSLSDVKVIDGDLDILGQYQFRAYRLQTINGNLVIRNNAEFYAEKLTHVGQNILARDLTQINLEQLKHANCVIIENVEYVNLPNLSNSKVFINPAKEPTQLIVGPNTDVIISERAHSLSDKYIEKILEGNSRIRNISQDKKSIGQKITLAKGILGNIWLFNKSKGL